MTDDEIRALLDALPDPTIPMMDALVLLHRVEVFHLDVDFDDTNYDEIYRYFDEFASVSLPRLRELVIKVRLGRDHL